MYIYGLIAIPLAEHTIKLQLFSHFEEKKNLIKISIFDI